MTRRLVRCSVLLCSPGSSVPDIASAQAIQALGLFEARCGVCHTKPADDRTPTRESLRARTPEAILDAITTGSMAVNADGISDAQKRMLAEYITDRPLGAALARPGVGDEEPLRGQAARQPADRAVVERVGRRSGQLALPAGGRRPPDGRTGAQR